MLPGKKASDLLQDQMLDNYLKNVLGQEKYNDLHATFYDSWLEHNDSSMIMITAGAPGIHSTNKGALVLTNLNQTWFGYIDSKDTKRIVVLYSKKTSPNNIPLPLKRWINRLLPLMENQEVLYIKTFSKARDPE